MNAQFWIYFMEYGSVVLGLLAIIALLSSAVEPMLAAGAPPRPIRAGVALIAPILTVVLTLGALFCGAYAASHKPTTCEKESK